MLLACDRVELVSCCIRIAALLPLGLKRQVCITVLLVQITVSLADNVRVPQWLSSEVVGGVHLDPHRAAIMSRRLAHLVSQGGRL